MLWGLFVLRKGGKEQMFRNFIKVLRELSGRYAIWDVWSDFVNISAIAIANPCDLLQQEEREKEYLRIMGRYQSNEQKKMVDLFAMVVMEMTKHPEQDILGDIYMELRISDKYKGQYFTPYHISEFMAEITVKEFKEEPIIINEPACGSGANLIAAANVMKKRGVNYQQNAYFVAQDLDPLVAKMCFIQLSLMGCPGVVIIGNSLTGNIDGMERWYTPFHFIYGRQILNRHKNRKEEDRIFQEQTDRVEETQDDWLLQMIGI